MARPGLRIHPKFLRLVRTLGEPAPHVYGHLEFLWAVAYENGDPDIGDATDVELAADWDGEPGGAFCRAVLQCGGSGRAGFIEEIEGVPGRYRVHDLYDHAPEYVRKRFDRETARKAAGKTLSEVRAEAARKRWETQQTDASVMQTDANGNHLHTGAESAAEQKGGDANGRPKAKPVQDLDANGCKCHANGTPPAPAPLESSYEDSCSEPPQGGNSERSILTFLIVGRGTKTWDLTQASVDNLSEAFPGIDVLAESRKARAWCEANATKRKSARGMPRFLFGWMERAQNQRGGKGDFKGNGHSTEAQPVPAAPAEKYFDGGSR